MFLRMHSPKQEKETSNHHGATSAAAATATTTLLAFAVLSVFSTYKIN